MANISLGPIVDGIRGSLGGCTFSRAASGPTVRARPRPPAPRRAGQLERQTILARAASTWDTLFDVGRQDWADYASTVNLTNSLGKAYRPTGQQAFVWYFATWNYVTGSDPASLARPGGDGLPTVPTLNLQISEPDVVLQSVTPAYSAGEKLAISVMVPDRIRAHNRMRVFIVYRGGSDAPPPDEIAYFDTLWFPPDRPMRQWFHWRFIDSLRRCSTLQRQYVDFTYIV